MPYPARMDVEKTRLTVMHCLKLPQLAGMISWTHTEKIKAMKKSVMILVMLATGFFCSGQSSTDSVHTGSLDSVKNAKSQKQYTNRRENTFHTTYEYTGSNGTRLVIQNSFPKSGMNYIDPNGKKYVYAVFWTQIINETLDPVELTIDFPLDSFENPSSSGNYMRLLLPSDTMTIEKEPLYDYGLAIKSFLDNDLHRSSSLKRTIHPKGSSSFYVVTVSDRGIGGPIRAGLSLQVQDLFYRVNDKEIRCGKINLKNLRLWK